MACTYCYHADPGNLPFKRGFMDFDLAMGVLSEAANLGVNSVKLNYRGEGTLHPKYHEIARYARDLASVHPNAFIDRIANSNFKIHPRVREDVFKGLACLTKVKVSYDSFRKEVFETQRAKGDHDLTTENIELFYNHPERIKSGTELVLQCVRTRLNDDEDFEGEAKRRWPGVSISVRDMVRGRVDSDLSALEKRKVRDEQRIPCQQAFVRLIVHHDGRVGPCCPSLKGDLIIGDLNRESVLDVFNSEIARQLRRDLKSGKAFDKDPCKTCSSFESYAGFKAPWGS
jgi:radical SAM protein with 4Fe4S-binding SPASM domain